MKTLYLIPARGGSKGVPRKNIKDLCGKPLIYYTIDAVRKIASDDDICVSTDDDEIIDVVESYGLKVDFKRPEKLSLDDSGTYDVLLHAINFYKDKGVIYDNIMLLQPTSPFRIKEHFLTIQELYNSDIDMVVSVGESHQSPYFTLFEENKDGFLEKSKSGDFETRQSAPPVYFFNGSFYLINIKTLREMPISKFTKVKKYIMGDKYSVDIDSPLDWAVCETMIKEGYIKL